MKKKALIFGVTGQDGSYIGEFLIKKNYIVHGVKRRSSSFNTQRIDYLYEKYNKKGLFNLHYGDVTDSLNVQSIIKSINPDEIYNLAAQSHVKVSFETPEYTANADALGTLRILESIKNLNKRVKFYQASTSEMFGSTPPPQSEKSVFRPVSPYGTSKVFSYWITKNYRDAYGLFACNGILFNHESPNRGETFVTRKITLAVANYFLTNKCNLELGNLDALRDWGDARDFVVGMWKILQQKDPDDYVLATGKSFKVKYFVEEAFKVIGVRVIWRGKGLSLKGIDAKTNKTIIKINKKYFRPNEVNHLRGNFSKARNKLNWSPKINIKKMIKDMVNSDISYLEKI
tara:strand:- start:606 stop:1637 length:1032 start_codon:yes stop_codon:yes gene_type:complete